MGKIFKQIMFLCLWIGKPFGIDIFIHWTWFVFMAFMFFTAELFASITLLILFVCVLAHELGHCLVAKKMELSVKDIYLLPIGGMAQIHVPPNQGKAEFLVTLGGPAVNFFIAPIALTMTYAFPGDSLGWKVCLLVFVANLAMALFNLIPMFPTDGGRIFRSIWTMINGDYLTATFVAVRLGQFLAVNLAIVGFYFGLFLLPIIAAFLIFAAEVEWQRAKQHHFVSMLKDKIAAEDDLAVQSITLIADKMEDKDLQKLVKQVIDERKSNPNSET